MKELIKKYKKEFDHWLNGGEVLFYTWKWYNSKDNPSSTFNHSDPSVIKYYIINDEFVEIRKALAEGKTVQYNFGNHGINKKDFPNKWKDLDISIGILADRASPKNYKIKTKELSMKALELLKADRDYCLSINNDKSIIDQYDEAIKELEAYITNYQGIKRRLDNTVTTLAVLQNENKSLVKTLEKMNKEIIELKKENQNLKGITNEM